MYLAKITSSWTPKNSLQKYIQSQIAQIEKMNLEDPETVFQFLQDHTAIANHSYRRCGKEKVTMREAHNGEEVIVECAVCQITLYLVRGLFEPKPIQGMAKLFSQNQQTQAQTLSIF